MWDWREPMYTPPTVKVSSSNRLLRREYTGEGERDPSSRVSACRVGLGAAVQVVGGGEAGPAKSGEAHWLTVNIMAWGTTRQRYTQQNSVFSCTGVTVCYLMVNFLHDVCVLAYRYDMLGHPIGTERGQWGMGVSPERELNIHNFTLFLTFLMYTTWAVLFISYW